MFVQVDCFVYPSMDSWCYFAPAAFARAPFHLSMPLLANFEGSDHFWALNWPGYLLLLSLVTPWLPKTTAVFVVLMLVQWLAVALLAAAWVRVMTRSRFWAIGALFLLLLDFQFFGIVWYHRHELVCCLALFGALFSVYRIATGSSSRPAVYFGLALSFFLLPLLQPTCALMGAAFLAALALQAALTRRLPAHLLPAGAAYVGGVLAFALYYLQPGALAVLRDHTQSANQLTFGDHTFYFGKTFLLSLLAKRQLGESVMVLGALAFFFWSLPGLVRSFQRGETRFDSSPLALTGFFCVVLLALTQVNFNSDYMSLVSPFAAALFCAGLARLEQKGAFRSALALLLAVWILQAGYFAGKTYVIGRAGFPDFPRRLSELRESLPAAHLILLPESMWEVALEKPGPFAMNTLPYASGPERRQRYEAMIYRQIEPGDLVLIDRLQRGPPLHPIGEPEWEKIGEKSATYFSWRETGFDITIWRKR